MQGTGGAKIVGAFSTHPAFYSSCPVGSEPSVEPEQNIRHTIWNLVYSSAPGGMDDPIGSPVDYFIYIYIYFVFQSYYYYYYYYVTLSFMLVF